MEIIISAYEGICPEVSDNSPDRIPVKLTVSQQLMKGIVLEIEGKRYHINASRLSKAIRALE